MRGSNVPKPTAGPCQHKPLIGCNHVHRHDLEQIAARLLSGELPVAEFVSQLSRPHSADLGEARLDLDRRRRCGFPEVIFAEGKSIPVLERIVASLAEHGADVLATRVSAEQADVLLKRFPAGRYNAVGRVFRLEGKGKIPSPPAPLPQAGEGSFLATV